MTSVDKICFQNLPVRITRDEFIHEILRIFPDVFTAPYNAGTLQVTLFFPYKGKLKAVVFGFSAKFQEMESTAKTNKILGRDINMKIDQGDERDEYGNFMETMTATKKRAFFQLTGITHRKATPLLATDFRRDINPAVFDGAKDTTVYLNTTSFDNNVIRAPGELRFLRSYDHLKSTRLRYNSVLETYQAIRYLNRNEILSNPPAAFFNIEHTEESQCRGGKGLGIDGRLIDIQRDASKNNGIISFQKLDPAVVDEKFVNFMFRSHCWRCEQKFTLIGFDVDLNFVAGVCRCDYTSRLSVLDSNRAYHWNDEPFTRLTLGFKEKTGDYLSLIIFHVPLKKNYEAIEEFRDTILPTMQEEWKFTSSQFKEKNSCNGKVIAANFVERLELTSGGVVDVYGVQVTVPTSMIWNINNMGGIRNVKLTLNVEELKRGEKVLNLITRKGKVFQLLDDDNEFVRVFIQVHLPVNSAVCVNDITFIVPKPNKLPYKHCKSVVNSLVREQPHEDVFNIILNQNSSENWTLNPFLISKKTNLIPIHCKIGIMEGCLNEEQKQALVKAQQHSASVIHGPPGCGKTHTLAAITIKLATFETGLVLACAPSNVAADGIASAIVTLAKNNGLQIKCLRIFSQTRERDLLRKRTMSSISSAKTNRSVTYGLRHEEIRKLPCWNSDSGMREILDKFERGQEYLLTKLEELTLKRHTREMEKEVMKNYDIFVCTLGALADTRVQSWTRINELITVVIDECGQLTQPQTIAALDLKPKRLILAGDHLQIRPTVQSYAAKIAGLDMSLLEFISYGRNKIPWTTLLEQHRMVPKIRGIVSAVTYNNKLRDAESVMFRKLDLPKDIFKGMPEIFNSPIVVYDHKGYETQIASSFHNHVEATWILEKVHTMLSFGVPSTKITILTLYEAQKQLIKSLLNKAGNKAQDVDVLNVDGFQGRENSIIALSLVRSNIYGQIGFASISNRLNTAISRARNHLLIFCNFSTFKKHKNQVWTKLTNELEKNAHFMHRY